jgi:hypothetical protein
MRIQRHPSKRQTGNPRGSSAAFISRAIKRHEGEAVSLALQNQSRRARKELERAETLRVVRKIRKEMRS